MNGLREEIPGEIRRTVRSALAISRARRSLGDQRGGFAS